MTGLDRIHRMTARGDFSRKTGKASSVLLSINFLLFMHVFRSNTLPAFKLRCSFLWASQTKTLMATKNTKRHKD